MLPRSAVYQAGWPFASPRDQSSVSLMHFSRDDEVSLHPADGEAFHRYRVAFPEQEATLLKESRWRQAD